MSETLDPQPLMMETAFKIDTEIAKLRKRIRQMEEQRDGIIDRYLRKGILQEGSFRIVEKIRTSSTVNVQVFKEIHPDLFDEMAQIPLTAARARLGKIDHLCDVKTQVRHAVEYIPLYGGEE